jgi:hypothetical protein
LKHFCRSIELNDSYLRGYYGLKLITSKLIPVLSDPASTPNKRGGNNQDDDEVPLPKIGTVKKLEEIATTKLAEIIRKASSGKTGYDQAEIVAARELLDRQGKGEQ